MRGGRALWCLAVVSATCTSVAVLAEHRPIAQAPGGPLASLAAGDAEDEAPLLADTEGSEDGLARGVALVRAAAQREAMVAAATRPSNARARTHGPSARAATTVAGIGRSSWSWLGPGNFGGRVRAVVIDRSKPQTIYVGGATGGIFKTTNGGKTWRPLDDFMGNLSVATLVSPAAAPRTLYAGTGADLGNGFRGAGVFKSVDGGATWKQLSETASPHWSYVNRLAVDPNAPTTLLAATKSGIWRTTNGGSNWRRTSTTEALEVVFDPRDGRRGIAGGSGSATYSVDGGQSWTPATGISGDGRVVLAYAPSDRRIVYASVGAGKDGAGKDAPAAVYRSSDGGRTYRLAKLADKTTAFLSSRWADVVWVDPTNPKTLVVGGIVLWRSTNSGKTFTNIVGDSPQPTLDPRVMHVDEHVVVSAPGYDGRTNRTVYVANDGGLYKTANILTAGPGRGWQSLNNRLGLTQFRSVAVSPSGTILGGTQDNNNLRYTGKVDAWSKTWGGDGGFAAADQTDSRYLYGESQNGHLFRSSDGGATAELIFGNVWGPPCKPAPYQITDVCNNLGNNLVAFSAPFVLDPGNPNRLLFGASSLWRTNDARTANTATTGPSWAAIKPPAPCTPPDTAASVLISAIAVEDDNSNVVYVGHSSGEICKSTDATTASPTWTRIGAGALPHRDVLRITIDPTNAGVVYATFWSYATNNVWRSTDGGMTWAPRSGSGATALPAVPVYTLAVNPLNPSWIYAGTESSVFASEDAGQTWGAPASGPANVAVEQLVWANRRLVAATYGRGMFSASVATTPTVPGSPTNVTATPGDAQVVVSWTRPADVGAGPITSYAVTPYVGGVAQPPRVVADVNSTTVGGLSNGTTYTFTVRARNSVGLGPASAATSPVVPAARTATP